MVADLEILLHRREASVMSTSNCVRHMKPAVAKVGIEEPSSILFHYENNQLHI